MEKILKYRLRRFLFVSLIILTVLFGPQLVIWFGRWVGWGAFITRQSGEVPYMANWVIALFVLAVTVGVSALIIEGLKQIWRYIMNG